jgi:3'-phosphoadenosine 5'-phosphosulfate sulfotransferase
MHSTQIIHIGNAKMNGSIFKQLLTQSPNRNVLVDRIFAVIKQFKAKPRLHQNNLPRSYFQ